MVAIIFNFNLNLTVETFDRQHDRPKIVWPSVWIDGRENDSAFFLPKSPAHLPDLGQLGVLRFDRIRNSLPQKLGLAPVTKK